MKGLGGEKRKEREREREGGGRDAPGHNDCVGSLPVLHHNQRCSLLVPQKLLEVEHRNLRTGSTGYEKKQKKTQEYLTHCMIHDTRNVDI